MVSKGRVFNTTRYISGMHTDCPSYLIQKLVSITTSVAFSVPCIDETSIGYNNWYLKYLQRLAHAFDMKSRPRHPESSKVLAWSGPIDAYGTSSFGFGSPPRCFFVRDLASSEALNSLQIA
jgi:hypothetical protein